MKAARTLSATLALALLVATPAAAVDLTGTWAVKGAVKCKTRDPNGRIFVEPDGNLDEIWVRQTGEDLWIEINRPGVDPAYLNKFRGTAYTTQKDAEKGYGVATACTVDGKYYAGAILIGKAKADAEAGLLSFAYTGTRLGAVVECKGKFERTSAVDPVITLTCP